MHIVLLGPPGSGKGTQGKVLADHFGVPHLSTGDLLRAEVTAGTALGRRLAGVIDRGELVADELIVDVVAAALHDRGSDGYLLDGLPRTVAQAEIIERDGSPLPAPDLAVHLAIDEGVVRQRLRRRAAEQGRADDADDVIDRRMQVYSEETEPLVDHYRRRGTLVTVDGDRPVDDVTTAIVAAVEQAQPSGGG